MCLIITAGAVSSRVLGSPRALSIGKGACSGTGGPVTDGDPPLDERRGVEWTLLALGADIFISLHTVRLEFSLLIFPLPHQCAWLGFRPEDSAPFWQTSSFHRATSRSELLKKTPQPPAGGESPDTSSGAFHGEILAFCRCGVSLLCFSQKTPGEHQLLGPGHHTFNTHTSGYLRSYLGLKSSLKPTTQCWAHRDP